MPVLTPCSQCNGARVVKVDDRDRKTLIVACGCIVEVPTSGRARIGLGDWVRAMGPFEDSLACVNNDGLHFITAKGPVIHLRPDALPSNGYTMTVSHWDVHWPVKSPDQFYTVMALAHSGEKP